MHWQLLASLTGERYVLPVMKGMIIVRQGGGDDDSYGGGRGKTESYGDAGNTDSYGGDSTNQVRAPTTLYQD